MTTPTKENSVDVMAQIKLTYTLSKIVVAQMRFIREYHNKETQKVINEAKARVNHYVKTIEKSLDPKEIENQEEISMEMLERIYNEVNQETIMSREFISANSEEVGGKLLVDVSKKMNRNNKIDLIFFDK